MKILHILQSNVISGAENMAADICMMFQSDHEMIYCSPGGPIVQSLIDRDVAYFQLINFNLKEVRRSITSLKPDIIHAHDVQATFLASLATGNQPIISHLHVNKKDMSRLTVKSILYLLAIKKNVNKVIVVSKSCLEEYYFKDLIKEKTLFLQNIIYTPRIEKLILKNGEKFCFDFVYMGRLSAQKNSQRVAKVASEILKICPTSTFGVIGSGELKGEMESIFQKEKVQERVVFTGRLDYPYKVLQSSKCMLMCSRYEGTPISVLEAMYLGVPVVSTPVDGIKAIIENRRSGYLADNDKELAENVVNIITKISLHAYLSKQAKIKFNKLNNADDYKNRLNDIYYESC